ncbi:acyltransferase ChoActase/COT/CPT [Coemansia reversa NRRL 1564]|uniref:Ubiquitin-like protein ATG12 n=1 Tax=Coemansia reversa (strain ATCC 12441 / NRRL 1564) TaxID=763665 RepID=A0A2G5BI09_COERN|nr:acyltransferase ChoActase/COT/CPT [Coemansia reversa NRRL 1564]|eukprot:PIA18656.1 acyltransferase ChoActase/COT/CPT [Coemansia reversa NRRL 1564]
MLSEQGRLPRLPIPPLGQTIERYVDSVATLIGNDTVAIAEMHHKANMFLKVGERLQQRLINYDKTQKNSWLESWWLELAYLSWRDGLCINSNYWLTIADDPKAYRTIACPTPLAPSDSMFHRGRLWESNEYGEFQIRRAVRFIQKALDYKESIDKGQILIERTKAGNLCMSQYKCIFGMTRIPRMGCDKLIQTSSSVNSRTIIVIVQDQIYNVHVYDDAGDVDPAISVLTAGQRDRWSVAYKQLEKQPSNCTTLAAIQEALFAVSLDTTYSDPPGSINAEQLTIKCHGTQPGHNRWYDKCANFIFDRNGAAGYMGEHSPCDALVPAIMVEYISRAVAREHISSDLSSACTPGYQPNVCRLRFVEIDTSILAQIQEAEQEVARTANASHSCQIRFEGYGASWIRKVAAVSPDAFVQFALQLTYFRIHGTFAPVYETASTRQFLHGRTETVRSLTPEAADFINAMCDSAVSATDKYEALVRASKKHQIVLKQASSGGGIDRHLLGLRLAYQRLSPLPEEPLMSEDEKNAIEEFFADPVLAKSSSFQLSTSGLFPAYYITHTGFGCVVSERGYGINYIIEPNRIKFGVEGKTKEVAAAGTTAAAAEAASNSQPKKVVVRFRSTGNAPILKKSVYKISSAQRFQALIVFLRKELGYKTSEPLFVYVNSAFSPAPDEIVYNLSRCFGLDGQLTINYATTPAWG